MGRGKYVSSSRFPGRCVHKGAVVREYSRRMRMMLIKGEENDWHKYDEQGSAIPLAGRHGSGKVLTLTGSEQQYQIERHLT